MIPLSMLVKYLHLCNMTIFAHPNAQFLKQLTVFQTDVHLDVYHHMNALIFLDVVNNFLSDLYRNDFDLSVR